MMSRSRALTPKDPLFEVQQKLVEDGILRFMAPSAGDGVIIGCAKMFGGSILSNDRFRDNISAEPEWVEANVIKFSWIGDALVLDANAEMRALGRVAGARSVVRRRVPGGGKARTAQRPAPRWSRVPSAGGGPGPASGPRSD